MSQPPHFLSPPTTSQIVFPWPIVIWEAVPVLRLGIHPEMERRVILNRSIPSTADATIGIPPAQAVNEAPQPPVRPTRRTQFPNLRDSIPDGKRFAQASSCPRSPFA